MSEGTGRQFNIFHAPLLSLFSRLLYIDVAKNWKGYGITYILFLGLMFTTPEIIRFQAQVEEVLDATAPIIIPQVPTIYISAGRLAMDKPSPHEIYNTKNNTLFAVIDTSNTYKTPKESKAFIYITDTKIFFKNSPDEYSQVDIKNLEDMTITHTTLYRWIEVFKKVFFYIVFPFFYTFTFIYLLSQVLFCSVTMFIFAKRSLPEISFAQIMRLGSIAITPPVILNIIHTILGIEFIYGGLVILIFGMGYLYFGYRAFAEDIKGQA